MFSPLKYKLVKALHDADDGYIANSYDEYDNVVGECFELYFVNGCLYENQELELPCFGCQRFYRTPEKYFLIRDVDRNDSMMQGYRVIDENGFGFWNIHPTKEAAIAEAKEHFEIIPAIQLYDISN